MLPVHLAENIRRQILYYLQSTFEFRDRETRAAFEHFLTDPENGTFKGPWVNLRLPYRPADPGEGPTFAFPVGFHPFRHQTRAWTRLVEGQSTIVTTGTGSGKTECFSLPILDHCLRTRRERGIKAIVLYPMNALAADQERRFAATIWNTRELRAAGVRVGNYTGRYDPADPGAAAAGGTTAMGPDHGITNHSAQLEDPPDILLTNYKMLDYLLLRPQDARLWRFNAPETLQFLVLDELHVYDGAQGADVACLIRRLKERLGIARGKLRVVGTSATLDESGGPRDGGPVPVDALETPKDRLARFAATLFEEDIGAEAVIDENRLSAAEIVAPDPTRAIPPRPEDCEPRADEDALRYAARQAELWGGPAYAGPEIPFGFTGRREADTGVAEAVAAWEAALGAWLRTTEQFGDALRLAERERGGPPAWSNLADAVAGTADDPATRDAVAASFFALVSVARVGEKPLVPIQVQLWVRELRRLGRIVAERPAFCRLDEPPSDARCLPAFHCSECGESGWIGLRDIRSETDIGAKGVVGFKLLDDPDKIYREYFKAGGRGPEIVIVSPRQEGATLPAQRELAEFHLCEKSLVARRGDGPCPLTGDERRFPVRVNQETRKSEKDGVPVGAQGCPNCGERDGLMLIGSRSATLSSVAIDELFGSPLNDDPKLLAFTDSVQDASHRAGFFSARTYAFTFRTALQHVVEEAGEIGLAEAGARLIAWWAEARPGWPGGLREALSSLMPPDLREYPDFLEYRAGARDAEPPRAFREAIEVRLTWEATSEFGLMQTRGRRMETVGAATLGWDMARVAATVAALRSRIEKIDRRLLAVDDRRLTRWVLGVLHRTRIRGGVVHPYLSEWAARGVWGKKAFGREAARRETYPPAGPFRPKLIVTKPAGEHDFILATTRGGRTPWHIVWARRALDLPNADEQTLLSLIGDGLLPAALESGLLATVHEDGARRFLAVADSAARLTTRTRHFRCTRSDTSLVRPEAEAEFWDDAPSLEYAAAEGRYRPEEFSARQRYYQDRYRKGALRRVVASEHTGLLATERREDLERAFGAGERTDDPNVLACTSTLEMGIDIGDLSSTMLCSIPPTTASYLQRIGRAGRATGTALVVSVVNQRPHDLFFYGRPNELLRGKVEPPGCRLDASAVLARQFLAYCFDAAVARGVLEDLPRTAKQLIEDLGRTEGIFPRFLDWIGANETDLRAGFLARFAEDVRADTRERLTRQTRADLLGEKIRRAATEADRTLRDLDNARKRLREQLGKLDAAETRGREEIDREIEILSARSGALARQPALEVLTEAGLLPNYAFPEKGVPFFGSVYNTHREKGQAHESVEVSRPAKAALRELAPASTFYTHGRQFTIQQIGIGNKQQPIIEEWAVCGLCGHMRRVADLERPDAPAACPQCGHDRAATSQAERGQRAGFVEFTRSRALSYMEHYESLSGDRSDERAREFFIVARSFDLTADRAVGAVADEVLPFGIEYREALTVREVNVGHHGAEKVRPFGTGLEAPSGFRVCRDCGIVEVPGARTGKVEHRRSCRARRQADKSLQRGVTDVKFDWADVYLYRELTSEAIRLHLPGVDEDDLATLEACLFLGLRIVFQGSPANMAIVRQDLPVAGTGAERHYLVLLDEVPGGTGYLKSLYQEKDELGREGHGIMRVLTEARRALETCRCRRKDADGCYRCVLTYRQQFQARRVSRERGIRLLGGLIEAGGRRTAIARLEDIRPDTLLQSRLEAKFVEALRNFVEVDRRGKWETALVAGAAGFRFSLPGSSRVWELAPQRRLGPADGVATASQPDFVLSCTGTKPVAIFTDGFEYHCRPNNRLADDARKRRAIVESGTFLVWNVTWKDLESTGAPEVKVLNDRFLQFLPTIEKTFRRTHREFLGRWTTGNGFEQLRAWIDAPDWAGWRNNVGALLFTGFSAAAGGSGDAEAVRRSLTAWRAGEAVGFPPGDGGPLALDSLSQFGDVVAFLDEESYVSRRAEKARVFLRLDDRAAAVADGNFETRWRHALAGINLFQFMPEFTFWAVTEGDAAPEIVLDGEPDLPAEWTAILDGCLEPARPTLDRLFRALAGKVGPPVCEHYDAEGESFAEIAWPTAVPPVALLFGAQGEFIERWRAAGWLAAAADDLDGEGIEHLAADIAAAAKGA